MLVEGGVNTEAALFWFFVVFGLVPLIAWSIVEATKPLSPCRWCGTLENLPPCRCEACGGQYCREHGSVRRHPVYHAPESFCHPCRKVYDRLFPVDP